MVCVEGRSTDGFLASVCDFVSGVCIKEGVFSHLGSGCSFIAEGAAAVAIVTG